MTPLATHVDPTPRAYTGAELRSHFALDTFGLFGDAAVAFAGGCRVTLESMVDLEDVLDEAPIASPRMLHLLVEHFELPLRMGVLRQRLLGRLVADRLRTRGVDVVCRGDDLYVDERKASVSIATRSPVSVVMHFGLNIETEGTPVPTWGLQEVAPVVDVHAFAAEVLDAYSCELADAERAVTKVRAVP